MRTFNTDEIKNGLYYENFRPQFHFSPATGWHNDPNGLVYYEGEYHLFYQYNPFDIVWGPMHWGHAVSKDMVHWQSLPVALEPDPIGTIFSGTIVVDWHDTTGFFDGKSGLVAIFTHHHKDYECQSIAYSLDKGRTWIKYSGNPVLSGDGSKGYKDFRDPKIFWFEKRKKWIAFLGGGTYRIYSSDNLIDWSLDSSTSIWEEFPDIFQLPVNGDWENCKWVLSTAGYGYYVGDFDGYRYQVEQPNYPVDYGASWQAAYTFNNFPDKKRCVWMAWMRDSATGPTFPWRCNFSIPRDLGIESTPYGYVMTQWPVKELDTLRSESFVFENIALVPGENPLKDLSSNTFDLEAEFEFSSDAEFGVEFLKGGSVRTVAKYVPHTRVAVVDVLHASATEYAPFETSFRSEMHGDVKLLAKSSEAFLLPRGNDLRMRVIADVSSVEVFFGNGEVVFSHSVYPPAHCKEISAFADGTGVVLKHCAVHYMNSIWAR